MNALAVKAIYGEPVARMTISEAVTSTGPAYLACDEPQTRSMGLGRSWLVAGATLVALSGTTPGIERPFLPASAVTRTAAGVVVRSEDQESSSIPMDLVPPAAKFRSDREEIAWIKEHSGLTWDQLGKVFGVSRRAVHMWANGGRLNETNARHLHEFSAVIRKFELESPGSTAEMIRSRCLQIESDGYNIIDQFRRDRSGGPSWGAPFGPERLIDAVREPLRSRVGEVGQ